MSTSKAIFTALIAITVSTGRAVTHHPGPYVPLCSHITLTANYLAEAEPGKGPGFVFVIKNDTNKEIRLAEPVPSSAHWYAHVGTKWLWRASSGSGGSFVDADNEKGEVFAYQPKDPPQHPQYIAIAPHASHEWTETVHDHPAIAYRPSCAICNNPGEHEYRAVFAYAYVPHPQEHAEGLLACGLRSEPAVMPPLSTSHLAPK
ncbi:hypothetical protein H7849_16465 [Alloacidobacterium dinghuense]|uniref:Uncharacterized protein n=1 Tax=Alloacidobacterium dinghuense TaxID=2763107 RepID=A0A7G8BDU4_9BACT|nr:hypothetical protein [Alloacidobacterium dinghuense]QNI30714.1 hypothetical protein H7849_16465 [Alloacidobacterium dinghuense]